MKSLVANLTPLMLPLLVWTAQTASAFYDPSTLRWINRDPIEETAGINLYEFAANDSINRIDPLGQLVKVVLDTTSKTLTVTDLDTGRSVTVEAFTGGHVNPDCSVTTPGTGKEAPAPPGFYLLVDNPNPTPGHEDWYGLFWIDERIDDYFKQAGKERSGVRLHLGGLSFGCVTVNKCQSDADKKWKDLRNLINNTKTETIKFRKGPHRWNPAGTIKRYGTVIIH